MVHWVSPIDTTLQSLKNLFFTVVSIYRPGVTEQPIRVHFYDLTWWRYIAPPLQFPNTQISIEIRYGDFFGYLHFILVDFGGCCCRHCSLGQNIFCTMSMEFQSPAHTFSGCAWMERALFTDSTLNKYGSWPLNFALTLSPRHSGWADIQSQSGCGSSPGGSTTEGPLGWVPIQSWKNQTRKF